VPPNSADESPWGRGTLRAGGRPRLVFGRMHEDPTVELEIFPAQARIFCIASAGCTALTLAAAGHEVTAVDANPAQAAYVEARLQGQPLRKGQVDEMLSRLRALSRLAGWSPTVLRRFCALDDTAEQERFWHERLNTRRFRAALGLILRPPALRAVYGPAYVAMLPRRFDRLLRARFERGWRRHRNRDNPFVRSLFLGEDEPAPLRPGSSITLHCDDAAEFLERAAPRSFDGFSLSNVLDGPSSSYADRLLAAVGRAASPGATLVVRSLREAGTREEAEWAARDRSLIWGTVRIERL
jgi:S-adenosylmethionine:diacylglycerol 3-amino-3-carboxypropyl transferase